MTVLYINSKEELDKELRTESRTVIVDFYADWCGPCRVMTPVLDFFANEYEDKAVIYKVNVDELPELATEYNISTIPTMVVFDNGVMREDKIVGTVTAKVLADNTL